MAATKDATNQLLMIANFVHESATVSLLCFLQYVFHVFCVGSSSGYCTIHKSNKPQRVESRT